MRWKLMESKRRPIYDRPRVSGLCAACAILQLFSSARMGFTMMTSHSSSNLQSREGTTHESKFRVRNGNGCCTLRCTARFQRVCMILTGWCQTLFFPA